jgi:hypothetical protein
MNTEVECNACKKVYVFVSSPVNSGIWTVSDKGKYWTCEKCVHGIKK